MAKQPLNLPELNEDSELMEFVHNFRRYWDQYGQTVLTTVLIVLLLFVGYQWWTTRAEQQRESAWADLATATSVPVYQDVAREAKYPAVKALALLRGADLLVQDAVTPKAEEAADAGEGEAGDLGFAAEPDMSPEESLAAAAGMYSQVLELSGVHKVYRVNAMQGLATISESQANWGEAKTRWQEVSELAGDDFPTIRAQADARLAMLDDLQRPVTFGRERPQPQTPAFEAPAGFNLDQMGASDEGVPVPLAPADLPATTPGAAIPTPSAPAEEADDAAPADAATDVDPVNGDVDPDAAADNANVDGETADNLEE